MIEPTLAEDYTEDKIKYPVGMQPKIDGVRSLNLNGSLTGKSLKCHNNTYITDYFSKPILLGLDGVMTADDECSQSLYRVTSDALNVAKSKPNIIWHCFDYITANTIKLKYKIRYELLKDRLEYIKQKDYILYSKLRLVPMVVANDLDFVNTKDAEWLEMGYDGTILRGLECLYKEGKSTISEGELLQIKRYIEEDAVVIGVNEGYANDNKVIINNLGRIETSSKIANKVSNGLIGSLSCIDIKTNKEIIVGAGAMPYNERKFYFDNPNYILNKIIKYRVFPKGVLNKPRSAAYHGFRNNSDIVIE